jgi:hypothetical protein
VEGKNITIIIGLSLFVIFSVITVDDAMAASNTTVGKNTSSISPTISITNGTIIIGQPIMSSAANTGNNSATINSNNQTNNIIPIPLIGIAPAQRTALVFIISFITIFLITFIARIILRYARRSHPNIKEGFWDIIRGDDWYPSLAIFQFLIWTFIITFAFLSIYLLRIFGGVLEPPPTIPTNILALMGISVAVPIVSGGVSRIKYTTSTSKDPPAELPQLSTMLEENKKPALTRFQMFGWTWIGIIIYIGILFSTVSTLMDIGDAKLCERLQPSEMKFNQLHCDKPLRSLTLPDIDPTLVILMGLSQGGYLGGKIVTTPTMKIERVVVGKKDNTFILSIFGNNFGPNKDTVWLDDTQIRDNNILSWNDSRIDASVGAISFVEGSKYKIRVSRDSLIEEKEYVYKNKALVES